MQILKDNYGKVILGISLLCLLVTLVVLRGEVNNAREFAQENKLEALIEDNLAENPVYPKEIEVASVTLKETEAESWKTGTEAGFEFGRYIYCPLDTCGRINKFSENKCYHCGTDLGLSAEEKALATVEKQKFEDSDGDGIINGLEDMFEFMDKANKNDVYLDEDGDGFTNVIEIVGDKTIDEQAEMLKPGKSFVYDPASAKSHPPLVDLLRVSSVNQAREMGVTLKSVNEIEEDTKTWEVAFNRLRASGRPETIWKKIGQTFHTNNDMEFEIVKIQKSTKEIFVKSVNSKRKVTTYLVEAKTTSGDVYHIKSKLFEKQGSKVVQFVYFNQPFYKKLVPFKVIMNKNFMLKVKVKGEIFDQIEYQLVGIKGSGVLIKDVKTNKEFKINKTSRDDRKYLKKRALSEKNK